MKRRGKWRDKAWLRGAELALTIHASRAEKGSVLAAEMDAAAIELGERISRSTYYRVRHRLHEKVAEELRR